MLLSRKPGLHRRRRLRMTETDSALRMYIHMLRTDLVTSRRRSLAFTISAIVVLASPAAAQDFGMSTGESLAGEGWMGFADVGFLIRTLVALGLAAVLGAAIAYHPRSRLVIDTVEEGEAPKIFVTYAVVGAVIGLMVVEFGLVVGFVVFGIGGLIRFRTTLPTATKTGRLILVTLIGLSAGLNLPHVAVLSTAFLYGLIYVIENRITYRVDVQGIPEDDVLHAWRSYRQALESIGCVVISERRQISKGKLAFVFQAAPRTSREEIEQTFGAEIQPHLQGIVDWEIE